MRTMKTLTPNKEVTTTTTTSRKITKIFFKGPCFNDTNASGLEPPPYTLKRSPAAAIANNSNYFASLNTSDMEGTTTHISLIDDDDEKDPLALDTSSGDRSSTEDSQGSSSAPSTSKHSHSLRLVAVNFIFKTKLIMLFSIDDKCRV